MHISPYSRAPISVSTTEERRTRRRVPASSRRRGALRRASLYRSGAVILIRVPALTRPCRPVRSAAARAPCAACIAACRVCARKLAAHHIHIAYRPAHTPQTATAWEDKPRSNEPMLWVDELVCARLPDEAMLEQFKMVLRAGESRQLLGVCRADGTPHAKYAYLDGLAADAEVLHPDIVNDHGYGMSASGVYQYDHTVGKAALLARLTKLVSGTGNRGTHDAPEHWSLHPYAQPGGGKLIHKHHGGPSVPDKHCMQCDAHRNVQFHVRSSSFSQKCKLCVTTHNVTTYR